jgi:hypothetical protein
MNKYKGKVPTDRPLAVANRSQDNIYNLISTSQGVFAFWDHYMQMFAMQYEGIAVTPKVKVLRYMYGCILPCRIEFTPFPNIANVKEAGETDDVRED